VSLQLKKATFILLLGRFIPSDEGGGIISGLCPLIGLPSLPSSRAFTDPKIAVTVFEKVYGKFLDFLNPHSFR
jgi:hypothetical protein